MSLDTQSLKSDFRQIRAWLFVLAISFVLVFPWIVNRPFSTKGEPREALTAQAMLETGNWILPERLANEFPTKPPLTHWLIAFTAYVTGGMSEGAARLPSALLATAVSLLLLSWTSKNFNPNQIHLKHGIVSAIFLLLCIEWHRASMTSRVDMTLSAFLFFGFISAYYWNERNLKGYPWLMLLTFSLATLTKGPVGLLLPGIVLSIFYAMQGHKINTIIIALIKVFVPALLLCSLWYALAYAQAGDRFLQIVAKENIGRFLGHMEEDTGKTPHAHNALYLYMTLLLGLIPWTIPLLLALSSNINGLFKTNKSTSNASLGMRAKNIWFAFPKSIQFSLIVCITFTAFFSMVESKRSVYLLPIYPFLSFIFAVVLIGIYDRKSHIVLITARLLAFLMLFAYVIAISTACIPLLQNKIIHFSKTQGAGQIYLELAKTCLQSLVFWQIAILSLPPIFAILTLIATYKKDLRASLVLSVLVYATCILELDAVLLPCIAKELSAQSFVQSLSTLKLNSSNCYSFGDRLYGLSYYLGFPLKELETQKTTEVTFKVLVLEREEVTLEKKLENEFILTRLAESKWGVEKPLDKVVLVDVTRKE